MSNQFPIFNGPATAAKKWFEFRNDTGKPAAEILIYEQIGKDWWDGSGVGAKDFAEELKAIPADRDIVVAINSPGGNVWDGLAIYHQLEARKSRVVTRIDGIAASIASVIALAGREVQMPKNALFMIHDPWSMAVGSADEMRKAADALDKHKDAIAGIYEKKTGKAREELNAKMSDETWFTGDEAKAFGFVDTVTDEATIAACASFDFSRFRRVPEAVVKATPSTAKRGEATPPTNQMNREKIVALLKKHGATVDDKATDEQLLGQLETILASKQTEAPKQPEQPKAQAPSAEILSLQNEIEALKKQNEAERKGRIENAVQKAIDESRIPANQKDKWVARALADETVLNDIAELPENPAGTNPVSPSVQADASPKDTAEHLLKIKNPIEQGQFFDKIRAKILPFVMNANTIGSDLKRVVLLQDMVRAFAKQIIQLGAFSTVFRNVQLQGTNEVVVPYYALDTTASTDWNATNGYVLGDTTTSSKKVTVNKRKYQGLSFTSDEFRRQPLFDSSKNMLLKAEKLGIDVFTDVLSVVTAANYGAAVFTGAASTFDTDDIADLRGVANKAHWPQMGRSLFLDSDYETAALKDTSLKNADKAGDSNALRNGQTGRIMGFDVYGNPNLPANGENLKGFISFPSAILVATSPIEPTEDVKALTRYEVVADPATGIAFEYRRWGNPDKDETREVVEANYGYVLGEAAAIERLVSA